MSKTVEQMRADGWPLRIIGNGGYKATLVECQPLFGGDYPVSYSPLTLAPICSV